MPATCGSTAEWLAPVAMSAVTVCGSIRGRPVFLLAADWRLVSPTSTAITPPRSSRRPVRRANSDVSRVGVNGLVGADLADQQRDEPISVIPGFQRRVSRRPESDDLIPPDQDELPLMP